MKIIYLEFNFLKKKSKFLIIALTKIIIANISNIIIYKPLNMDK